MSFNSLREWFDNKGILLVVLALFLAATGYWGYQRYTAYNQMQNELNNRYEYAFQELNDHLDRLQRELGTLVIGTDSDNISVNLSDVWQSAYAAHEDVGQLPLNSDALENLKQLLMGTVNYSSHLDREIVSRKLKQPEKEMLKKFHQQVRVASKELEEVHNKMARRNFNWHDKKRVNIDKEDEEYSASLAGSLEQINKNIELTSINQRLSKVLKGNFKAESNILGGLAGASGKEINEQKAIDSVQEFVNQPNEYNYEIIDQEEIRLQGGKKVKTRLPTHAVKAEGKENENRIYADVSKKNGQVVWLLKRREIGGKKLDYKEAVQSAEKFLQKNNYLQLVPISSKVFNRILIASFAPMEKEAIIKPERVLVEVALDNGEVIGFNGINNILNQKSRSSDELKPKLTQKEAENKLSNEFSLTKQPELVLDKIRGRERLCYQFTGRIRNEPGTYRVKINAKNGKEEEVKNIEDDIYQPKD